MISFSQGGPGPQLPAIRFDVNGVMTKWNEAVFTLLLTQLKMHSQLDPSVTDEHVWVLFGECYQRMLTEYCTTLPRCKQEGGDETENEVTQ